MISSVARLIVCLLLVLFSPAHAQAAPITFDLNFEIVVDCVYDAFDTQHCSFDRYVAPISFTFDDQISSVVVTPDGGIWTNFGAPQFSVPFSPLPPLADVPVVQLQSESLWLRSLSDGISLVNFQAGWYQVGPEVCDAVSCRHDEWRNVMSVNSVKGPSALADLPLFLSEDGELTFVWFSTLYTVVDYTDAVGGGVDLVDAPGSRSVVGSREAPEPTLAALASVGVLGVFLRNRVARRRSRRA
jgi:hypothetical protein